MNKWYVMNVILSDHCLSDCLTGHFEGIYQKYNFYIDASLMNLSLQFHHVATDGSEF